MTITPAAGEIVRDWLRRSELPDPVVYLAQSCDTPSEVLEALKRGISRKELARISTVALAGVPKYLYPAIYPRAHFLWVLTTRIGGFPFASPLAHPHYARRAMKRGVLDAAERGLVLKDVGGTVVMPKAARNA